ncbi:MAG: hypothetical protein JWO05_663 [Gemmatimonadetes bacterium]|nr:hypothetical protein [Gemmatimonadota bacterium]
MREVEVKSVVPHVSASVALVEAAGGTLTFAGRLEDKRWDTVGRELSAREEVLRTRVYRAGAEVRAELDWKGPNSYEGGYKTREELGTGVTDPALLEDILSRLGYLVTMAIDREIRQYELHGAVVRFEHYPRMDDLVEVEGEPGAIERAIVALALPRAGFTSERLPAFVQRYEARTGQVAALSDLALTGDTRYAHENA